LNLEKIKEKGKVWKLYEGRTGEREDKKIQRTNRKKKGTSASGPPGGAIPIRNVVHLMRKIGKGMVGRGDISVRGTIWLEWKRKK